MTRNGGASWTPLTDKQRSLSIASLAFDPTDASRGTLIAGVGITSDGSVGVPGSQGRGGKRIGVLYSTNGGDSWRELGGEALAGKSIVGVAARGSTLLAAAAEPHNPPAAGGLYCSVDGGGSFDLMSGTRGLGERPGLVAGRRQRQRQRLLCRGQRQWRLQEQQRRRRLVARRSFSAWLRAAWVHESTPTVV